VPRHGLRVSAVGLQLGLALPWQAHDAANTSPLGDADADADADVTLPPGTTPLSAPFAVQALATAHAAPTADRGEDGGWVVSAAVSPISVRMTGAHAAALVSVAEGLAAEVAGRGEHPLASRVWSPDLATGGRRVGWVDGVGLEVGGLRALVGSAGVAEIASAPPPAENARALVYADSVQLWLQSSHSGGHLPPSSFPGFFSAFFARPRRTHST
jgi:hypothetical protein